MKRLLTLSAIIFMIALFASGCGNGSSTPVENTNTNTDANNNDANNNDADNNDANNTDDNQTDQNTVVAGSILPPTSN